jgi:type IV secretory pathway VirD2 relaxase
MPTDTLRPRFRQKNPPKPPRVGTLCAHVRAHIQGTAPPPQQPPRTRHSGRGVTVRDPGPRYQRVVVKPRLARARSHGFRSMQASTRQHLAYIAREGVELGGERGQVYTAYDRGIALDPFIARAGDDHHQFRLVVSPEHGGNLDLTTFTREYMAQIADDLGTRLDWVAVNHHDTAHPHVHLVIRGVDDEGKALYFRPDYLTDGLRFRAMECATMQLGYRHEPTHELAQERTPQVGRERGSVEMEI